MKKLLLLALLMATSISMAHDCPPGQEWNEDLQGCYSRPSDGVRG